MYSAEKIELDEETTRKLPEPQGYKLLIAIPKLEEKTSGGVIIPDKLKGMEQTASIIGLVIALGKAAYNDADKFPDGEHSWTWGSPLRGLKHPSQSLLFLFRLAEGPKQKAPYPNSPLAL